MCQAGRGNVFRRTGDWLAAGNCGNFGSAKRVSRRSIRRRRMRFAVAVAALFALGLLVSGALGDVSPITIGTTFSTSTGDSSSGSTDTSGPTATATTGSSTTSVAPTSTVATSAATATSTAPTTSGPATTTAAPTTSGPATTTTAPTTTSAPPTGPFVPYIVTFASGTPQAQQQAEIVGAGAVDTAAIAPLYMHSVDVSQAVEQATVAALQADADVVRVERDHSRDTATIPNDPRYTDQWSLPRIGWDTARDSVTPTGNATVAVLDTGVDASH